MAWAVNVSPAYPPASLGVDQAAERVEQRVDVGADVQPVELHVVADVGDDGQLDAIAQEGEPVRELRASRSTGEERDLHRLRVPSVGPLRCVSCRV